MDLTRLREGNAHDAKNDGFSASVYTY